MYEETAVLLLIIIYIITDNRVSLPSFRSIVGRVYSFSAPASTIYQQLIIIKCYGRSQYVDSSRDIRHTM